MPIEDFCNETLTVEHVTGSMNPRGETAYSDPVSYVCRLEQTMIEDWGPQGRVFVPGVRIIFPTPVDIKADDRITLPDGTTPLIRSIRIAKGSVNAHHTTIEAK